MNAPSQRGAKTLMLAIQCIAPHLLLNCLDDHDDHGDDELGFHDLQ